MSKYLKIILFIINNEFKVKYDIQQNIKFIYYFLSNDNITAFFLARYIVLKLKKGFNVIKTLNPLRRELIRVSKKSRGRRLPYYYIIGIQKQKQQEALKIYKKSFHYYLNYCSSFFFLLLNKFYNNNNILLFSNIYLYHKKLKKKVLKQMRCIHDDFLVKFFKQLHIVYYPRKCLVLLSGFFFKYFIFKFNKLKKYKILKKFLIIYPLVFNLEKKKIYTLHGYKRLTN